jgi:uncharacterized OB-fold protein
MSGLVGSTCPECAVTTCPAQEACPRCGQGLEPLELSGRGRLWTWTVQRYAPKSPPYVPPDAGFSPYAVGYVELSEGVRVLAVLDVPLDEVTIGMPLRISAAAGVPRAVVDR